MNASTIRRAYGRGGGHRRITAGSGGQRTGRQQRQTHAKTSRSKAKAKSQHAKKAQGKREEFDADSEDGSGDEEMGSQVPDFTAYENPPKAVRFEESATRDNGKQKLNEDIEFDPEGSQPEPTLDQEMLINEPDPQADADVQIEDAGAQQDQETDPIMNDMDVQIGEAEEVEEPGYGGDPQEDLAAQEDGAGY